MCIRDRLYANAWKISKGRQSESKIQKGERGNGNRSPVLITKNQTTMSNKLILDTQDITDGFFEDTRLLGIMAPMKDYQFCWQLNNMLGVDSVSYTHLTLPTSDL